MMLTSVSMARICAPNAKIRVNHYAEDRPGGKAQRRTTEIRTLLDTAPPYSACTCQTASMAGSFT